MTASSLKITMNLPVVSALVSLPSTCGADSGGAGGVLARAPRVRDGTGRFRFAKVASCQKWKNNADLSTVEEPWYQS